MYDFPNYSVKPMNFVDSLHPSIEGGLTVGAINGRNLGGWLGGIRGAAYNPTITDNNTKERRKYNLAERGVSILGQGAAGAGIGAASGGLAGAGIGAIYKDNRSLYATGILRKLVRRGVDEARMSKQATYKYF